MIQLSAQLSAQFEYHLFASLLALAPTLAFIAALLIALPARFASQAARRLRPVTVRPPRNGKVAILSNRQR